jgi:sulfate adenylyltransferase subunit 1
VPVKLLAQTRRHALLAQLLRVPSIVFAINKLDAVDDPAQAYEATRAALLDFAEHAGMEVAGVIPVSALRGDNVTQPLDAPWYNGPSLLQLLECLPTAQERTVGDLLIPVQYVARDGDGVGDQPRTLWGRIAHGRVQAGDEVQLFPSKQKAVVAEVRVAGELVEFAEAGQSAGLSLDRQLDVSRGDWISTPDSVKDTNRFSATLAWLDTEPAVIGRKYSVRHGNRWVQARITAIESRLDIHTLEATDAHELAVNEIGHVLIETQQPLPVEAYATNRVGGSLIIVDPASNRTSGALLVKAAA